MGPMCDVCQIEFTSSQPQPAVADAPLGGGLWGYVCETHKSYARGGLYPLMQDIAWEGFVSRLDKAILKPCDCGGCGQCD